MKESWSPHTVKRDLHAPSSVDSNDWLEDKADAHGCMRSSRKPEDNSSRTKTAAQTFPQNRI